MPLFAPMQEAFQPESVSDIASCQPCYPTGRSGRAGLGNADRSLHRARATEGHCITLAF